ncbi:MAG: hypothetical protein HY908_30145 [Myxococcales bacterium]|nr:hypothetical protein [Myxococcales bacterium]
MELQAFGWVVFGALGLAALGGCAAPVDGDDADASTLDGTSDELGTKNKSYVTARVDMRKCMAPLCGGYFVRDVNRKQAERYVSGLDFGPSGLDPATQDLVRGAGELVLRGKLGPADPQFGTRTFLVYEAYRGMPGVTPIEGDVHYVAAPRDPHIECFAAPCNNEVATKLNFAATTYFTGYSVELASLPLVDQDWLVNQVQNHGAATAALIVDGQHFAGGYEQILDASQVYLRLPLAEGPCPKMPEPACEGGTVPTYTRSADRCVVFDACVAPGSCAQVFPSCSDGYTLATWKAGPLACPVFACDPSFTVE